MMNMIEERLATCFAAVFANRSREEIQSATRDSIPEWDSLAAVTLLSLIQQEFNTDIDLFDFENLSSFQELRDHLERTAVGAGENAANG